MEPPPDERIREAIGLGLDDSLRHFFPEGDAMLYERVLEGYRQHWIATYHLQSRPFAEAETLLTELGAGGYLLAVATAKSRRGLARDFERTGLERFFAASRTITECAPKPDPEMLHELMQELEVAPPATLLVGDSLHDLEMAAAAGVDAVAVSSGAAGRERLLERMPRACLGGVGELGGWLRGDPGRTARAEPPRLDSGKA